MEIKVNNNNPYVFVENNIMTNTKGKNKINDRVRRVYKRNVALSLLYVVLTFGIYWFFWQYEIAKETNKLTNNEDGVCPALVVFLTFITFGIYGIYWSYTIGKKQDEFNKKCNINKNLSIVYLILALCNYVMPILNLISYSIMQTNNNSILQVREKQNINGVYVSDNNIFNRPYLSVLVLFVISEVIPALVSSQYEKFFIGVPGNPSNLIGAGEDATQQIISNSAEQIIYADSLFMLSYNILQIFTILAVLWWFYMRFRHSDYLGVLCIKNLGRALLFALPGLLFVAINLLSLEIENFRIGIVILGFVPAFCEEISIRGMIIPNFMRIFNRSKGIWCSLFITSTLFGVIHFANVFSGAHISITTLQVFYTFALGILLASILIRTGNLWPCIIIHGAVDALALMTPEALEQGAVQTQALTWSVELIPIIVISLIFIGYGLFICRPKKHDEICKLWADKWGDALLNA